jgi:DNA-binding transcriptional ArsR family regulator
MLLQTWIAPLQPDPSDAVFAALADPTRRGLFAALCRGGEQNVAALTRAAGVSQSVVSRHLGVLTRAGLVTETRQGRETRVSPRPEGLAPLADWTRAMQAFWDDRLDALETLLRRIDR